MDEIEEEKRDKGEEIGDPVLLGDHNGSDTRNGHGDEVVEPIAERLEVSIKKALEEEMSRAEQKITKKHYRKVNMNFDDMKED